MVKLPDPKSTFPPVLPPPPNGPIVSSFPFKLNTTPLVSASVTKPTSDNISSPSIIIVPPLIVVPPV